MNTKRILPIFLLGYLPTSVSALPLNLAQTPLYLNQSGTPLIMLTMERDHKLYYEAYNDAADINGDGKLDIRYNSASNFLYYGYFDSKKCYTYASGKFSPSAYTANKQCSGAWSGDYLNYLTTSRIDALRRVLYGGKRSTDTTSSTVLERSYIPQDAHSWGKEYTSIAVDGFDITKYTPFALPTVGTRHLFANTTLLCPSGNSDPGCGANAGLPLLRVIKNTTFRVWEWLSIERPIAGVQCATGNNSRSNCTGAGITDFVVRVDACVTGLLETEECRGYPTNTPTVYKPTGLLQQYGENDRMAFGLITGSYDKNVSGGVLRKNISSLTDEINLATGQFTATNGIIKTLDALKIIGFGSDYFYNQSCQVPEVANPLAQGRCRMWGNPTAEIMYEGLRYFAGKTSPTTQYSNAGGTDDTSLGLPQPAWQNPYRSTLGGYPVCSKPSLFVISDINPNYDTDLLPGRHNYTTPSATPAFTGDISLNVESLAQTIWDSEYGSSKSLFIGQSDANSPSYDGAPTAKTVTSFGTMRGLSPEEPSQQGGFYAASIALFGKTNDLNAATGKQKTDTFSVALASPLPRIIFPLTEDHTITLVPFAKTVGGCGLASSAKGSFQPTNTIVDFYVDTIKNTDASNMDATVNGGRAYAKFRINYEDSEYGSDHDMDAIVEYELTAKSNGTLDVKSSANYGAGSCIQHMGYVISGTSADNIYLEVRDPDTSAGSDVDYYLDTPNTPGVALPTSTTRNFSIGVNSTAAFVAHDPLWYASKWGGFIDINDNDKPDLTTEWDNSNNIHDGVPDTYFLVTNASKLKDQMDKAFTEILNRDTSASAVATNSTSLRTQGRVYQATFNPLTWSGQLLSFAIDIKGKLNPEFEWDAGSKINTQNPATGRVIITRGATGGVAFDYSNLTGPSATVGTQKYWLDRNAANTTTDNCGPERVAYLRGDVSHEAAVGTFNCASGSIVNNFRERPTSKLGDIVNSNPWYVGAPSAGLSDVDFPGYSAFRRSKQNRTPVVYTGSNDGMLHGFDASLTFPTKESVGVPTATSGNEVLAYIPSAVFPNLSKLTAQTYNQNHLFFVDGSPMVADVFLTSWHTVLVGAMAAGGRGYYALDITDPSSFTEGNADDILLWEFNQMNDADMGYAYNLPPASPSTGQAKQIIKLSNDKWAVIAGNGYNSSLGKAVLYIFFIQDGADGIWSAGDYVKIVADVPASQDNGLSTPVPFDTDNDGFADTVYAGDLKGNMWKFLVGPNSSDASVTSTTSTWKVAFSGVPLFKAKDGGGLAQPIMWPPEVTLHSKGGQLIMFGTGKSLETADTTNTQSQTLYGIWDRNDGVTTVGTRDTDLLQQTVALDPDNANFRIPSNNVINWRPAPPAIGAAANCPGACTPTHMGWYMNLPTTGERTTGIPKLINKVIFFNTLIPSSAICEPNTGWLMSLNFENGGLVEGPIFDTNGIGSINDDDTTVGGFKVGAAIGGTTLIEPPPLGTIGAGVSSLTTGDLISTPMRWPAGATGRVNWREMVQ